MSTSAPVEDTKTVTPESRAIELVIENEKDFVRALIDALLRHKRMAVASVAEWFKAEWMHTPWLRDLADALLKVRPTDQPVTAASLARVLAQNRHKAVPLTEIGAMIHEAIGWAHIEYFARRIYETYRRRYLSGELSAAAVEIEEAVDVDAVVDALVNAKRSTDLPANKTTQLKAAIEEIVKDASGEGGSATELRVGAPVADAALGAVYRGELILVGARVGCGKSALLCQMAAKAAAAGTRVTLFSLEMTYRDILERVACVLSGANAKTDRRAFIAGLAEARELVTDGRLMLVCKASDIAAIERDVSCHVTQNNCEAVFVDYLQLVRGTGKRESRETEIADVSRRLKLMALEWNIPVIAACQVNREGQDAPSIAHLRGSGALEQDADKVVLLHPQRHIGGSRYATNFIVGKNRRGPVGVVEIEWDCSCFVFGDVGSCPASSVNGG